MSRRTTLGAVLVAGGLLAGCGAGSGQAPAQGKSAAGVTATTPSPSRTPESALDRFRSVRTYAPPAKPTRVRIPSVGIASKGEEDVQRGDGGVLDTPTKWQDIGWYAGGPRPGQVGPAVILGHVDSTTGPAVFKRLPEVHAGTAIYVDLADHTTLTFVVDKVVEYPKVRFPTDAVYFPTLDKSLRLITCGGAFNEKTHHYVDNIVVYATLQD